MVYNFDDYVFGYLSPNFYTFVKIYFSIRLFVTRNKIDKFAAQFLLKIHNEKYCADAPTRSFGS